MKPQLYSIVILLLARNNYAQNTENSKQDTAASATQLPPIPPNSTSVAKPPEDNISSITKASDDHKTSAPATAASATQLPPIPPNSTSVAKPPEGNVTSVTKAPKGNTTTVTKTARETVVSEIPTDKVTVLSEAPNSKATSAPSLAPNVSSVRTTKGFTTTTGSTSMSIRNQTSNLIMAGNATTQQINKVTDAVHKTTRPTSTKPTTMKATGNRTSAFPVPSLFAIVLLVISVLCF